MSDYLDLTDVIGQFGTYQKRIMLINLMVFFVASFAVYNMNFVSRTPTFRCDTMSFLTPNNRSETSYETEGRFYNGTYDNQCHVDIVNDQSGNFTVETVSCDSFIYLNKQRFSIAQEWNLVCSSKWLVSLGYSVYSFGNLVAMIPAGYIADRFGRRFASAIGVLILLLCSVIFAISDTLFMFLCTRFVSGLGFILAITTFISVVEQLGSTQAHLLQVHTAAWGFGYFFLTGISWLIVDWKYMMLATTPLYVLSLFLILRYFYESIRWLLSKRKYSKAQSILENILALNNIDKGDIENTMLLLQRKLEEDRKWNVKATFCTLMKSPNTRRNAIILTVVSFSSSFITRGFDISATQMDGSFHVNMAILGASKLFLAIMVIFVMKLFKRKTCLVTSCLITTVCFFASSALPAHRFPWLKFGLGLVGSISNGITLTILNMLLVEVFPTNMRATMKGYIKTFGRVAQIITSFTDLVGKVYGQYVVAIIFGCLSCTAGIVSLFLPETKNLNLPDTFGEAKKLSTKPILGGHVSLSNVEMRELPETKTVVETNHLSTNSKTEEHINNILDEELPDPCIISMMHSKESPHNNSTVA